ncbi:DNA-binding protein [Pandoraea anapnoica]|uniref:DNA-binding protein n=1 Tax=Pandoraea anapnoica TaxID=2508301 RepID=A0A5E5AHQ3_9BURK|nr:DNA-binding protein [Pandoraea iniqua]VVE73179.1 DNA-binding protein [Pandoraea anapnoica]
MSLTPQSTSVGRFLTTNELASAISLRPQSIRKRYSQTGSYHGVVPLKLEACRRLLWPANAVEQLAKRGRDVV